MQTLALIPNSLLRGKPESKCWVMVERMQDVHAGFPYDLQRKLLGHLVSAEPGKVAATWRLWEEQILAWRRERVEPKTAERLAVCRLTARRWCLFAACLRWAGAQTDFTPLLSASSCHGQNSGGGMLVCVCVFVDVCLQVLVLSLYRSNFHYSFCMSQKYSLHFLHATLYQYLPFLLSDWEMWWTRGRHQITCRHLCARMCVLSLMDLRVNNSVPQWQKGNVHHC